MFYLDENVSVWAIIGGYEKVLFNIENRTYALK